MSLYFDISRLRASLCTESSKTCYLYLAIARSHLLTFAQLSLRLPCQKCRQTGWSSWRITDAQYEPGDLGPEAPLSQAKQFFSGQSLNFSGSNQQPKWEILFVFIKRKNTHRPTYMKFMREFVTSSTAQSSKAWIGGAGIRSSGRG